MRGLPRRSMLRLAQAIMIACVAALARRCAPKGALPPFIPRRFARRERLMARQPPDPPEEGQRSMLRWPPWRMRHGARPLMSGLGPNNYLIIAKSGGDHDVVAAGANRFVFTQLRGANDGFAYVQQLAIPPHLFGGPAPSDPCSQSLN
jgi:hypothetical protein